MLCLMATLILASCGGGGSDSGSPTYPPVVVSASPAPPAGIVAAIPTRFPYDGFWFVASGGSPPFTWAVTSGALPGESHPCLGWHAFGHAGRCRLFHIHHHGSR